MLRRSLFRRPKVFSAAIGNILELWIAKLNLDMRLSDIVDFFPNPTLIMDINGVVSAWNKSMEELTGWEKKRILGKGNYEHAIPFYDERRPTIPNLILNPNPDWEARYIDYKKKGKDVYVLSYCPSLPGGGAYITCKASPCFDINNALWGSIQTLQDVTQERQMEKNLHVSKDMYRITTDFAGIGMMLLRKDKVLYCNERLSRFMGIPGKEITLDNLSEWVHPEDREKVAQNLASLFERIEEETLFEFRTLVGSDIRHYRCNAQVMEYEDQPTIHFILDDMTRQRELADKARLNELKMYHDDRLIALGTMAAGIAHELNQPLNTIRVVTDGLLFGREEGWYIDSDEMFRKV